jgi:hypothetical protein
MITQGNIGNFSSCSGRILANIRKLTRNRHKPYQLCLNSLSVAMTSALLLGVGASSSEAVVTGFNLSQFADYVQTSNAQPVGGSFRFFPSLNYTDLEDFSTQISHKLNEKTILTHQNCLF